jgi:hypothetical protein
VNTQPLQRVIRDCIARMVATGAPATLDLPVNAAGFRLILARQRVRGTDEALLSFDLRAPASVTHYLWSSSVVSPGLADDDRDVFRDEVESVLFRYLNPLAVIPGQDRTVWLLSETENIQLARVMALPVDQELDYIFLTAAAAQWTGPVRGLHKTMATLAQTLSRHPDFVTGKAVCRPPTSFLFLGDVHGVERAPSAGIGVDGRNSPMRGIFALDTSSYMDALVQLGEDEARELAAVQFSFSGTCLRAQGPLAIPIYRIPHAVQPAAVRSVTMVNGNRVIFEAASPSIV